MVRLTFLLYITCMSNIANVFSADWNIIGWVALFCKTCLFLQNQLVGWGIYIERNKVVGRAHRHCRVVHEPTSESLTWSAPDSLKLPVPWRRIGWGLLVKVESIQLETKAGCPLSVMSWLASTLVQFQGTCRPLIYFCFFLANRIGMTHDNDKA